MLQIMTPRVLAYNPPGKTSPWARNTSQWQCVEGASEGAPDDQAESSYFKEDAANASAVPGEPVNEDLGPAEDTQFF